MITVFNDVAIDLGNVICVTRQAVLTRANDSSICLNPSGMEKDVVFISCSYAVATQVLEALKKRKAK